MLVEWTLIGGLQRDKNTAEEGAWLGSVSRACDSGSQGREFKLHTGHAAYNQSINKTNVGNSDRILKPHRLIIKNNRK